MTDSILNSVKKPLGLLDTYTVFDEDIILHVNSVFSTLNQLGVGPTDGFMIEDASATWTQFLGSDKHMSFVKTYVYLRVRLLFDPPSTANLVAAMQQEVQELTWRINAAREATEWSAPDNLFRRDPDECIVIDGGTG